MKKISVVFFVILIVLPLLSVVTYLVLPDSWAPIDIWERLAQFTGTIAISLMSVAMILVTRFRWLEQRLDGLDKAYRLHKWLGIAALLASIGHWLVTRILENLEESRELHKNIVLETGLVNAPIEAFLGRLHFPAMVLAHIGFYSAVILIIVALTKNIPYRFFAYSHRVIALSYLFLVFHSVVLMDIRTWTQPAGVVTALLLTGGVVAGAFSLFGQIGRSNRATGQIRSLLPFPDIRVIEANIELDNKWKGHRSGQFAFVTFDRREGKHPYTIASAWDPERRNITFITRGLGDYTDTLPEGLEIGDTVLVEGPYGCFTFDDVKERQIWIAGGIGITPFIARMKQLATMPGTQEIDLFFAASQEHQEVEKLLEADAAAAKVNLHLVIDGRDNPLTGQRLRKIVPDWQSASVWFCGPALFGKAVRNDLVANGFRVDDFHQELFNMR
ncbi:MAG: ferric reductase-like transmembrane domain-containing protein [Roseibium sp.]|uniref:ferredoxin reductase family protein n=1 Tax=Roseibium sp. TaxID=1936156 RepID=UPI0026197F85|nr:ferric reductase-like transmembrane domain-containing protein [Roseibium sp.]MCV0428545.1 ferric reductase-like transmembrane domain-containing protein [Roseibium sp.]